MNTLYNNKYDILASTIAPNPASVKYWADLSSNPNGGDLKYHNGKTWVWVNNQASENIKQLQADLTNEVSRATQAEKDLNKKITDLIGDAPEILDTLPELIGVINNHAELINTKVDKVSGKGLSTNDYTTEDKNKLASLSSYNDTEVRELIAALTIKINSLEERVAQLENPTV